MSLFRLAGATFVTAALFLEHLDIFPKMSIFVRAVSDTNYAVTGSNRCKNIVTEPFYLKKRADVSLAWASMLTKWIKTIYFFVTHISNGRRAAFFTFYSFYFSFFIFFLQTFFENFHFGHLFLSILRISKKMLDQKSKKKYIEKQKINNFGCLLFCDGTGVRNITRFKARDHKLFLKFL